MIKDTRRRKVLKATIGCICAAVLLCAGIMGGEAFASLKTPLGEEMGTTVTYGAEEGKLKHKYIPVLMYHHFTTDPKPASTATITEAKFRLDMAYLQVMGYTALLPQDIKAIQEGKKEMPEKPVMITIDDGYESAYTIAYPILKETGMKATVYIIVNSIENPTDKEIKKLSWEQLKEMYESGIFDVQSHSYNMHNPHFSGDFKEYEINGIQVEPEESKAKYVQRVAPDIWQSIELIEKNVGTDVISYSYPYGAYEPWGAEILQGYGMVYAVGTVYGLADLEQTWFNMNRFSVGMGTMLWDLIKIPGIDIPEVSN